MNMKNLQRCVIASLFAVSALSAHAAAIVSWGNSTEYVTGTAEFSNFSAQTTGNFWRSGAPANVTPTTGGYGAPAGKTNDIFAVFQQETANATKTHEGLNIADNSTADYIRITGRNPGTGETTTLSGLIYFTQAGFLNGYSSGTIGISQIESIKLTLSDQGGASNGTGGMRMAIHNNGTWYVSESQIGISAGTTSFENLGDIDWETWNPNTFPLNAQPSSFTVSGSSFTDIQAFGFYYNVSRVGAAPRIHYQGFEVIAIPEPGTLALVGIALGSLLLFRRKR